MSYIAPWGRHYNLDTIESIEVASNKVRAGYYQAEEDHIPKGWDKFLGLTRLRIKGRFYVPFEDCEQPKERALYPDNTVLVFTNGSEYGKEWNFKSAEAMNDFIRQFDNHKGCKYEPPKNAS